MNVDSADMARMVAFPQLVDLQLQDVRALLEVVLLGSLGQSSSS